MLPPLHLPWEEPARASWAEASASTSPASSPRSTARRLPLSQRPSLIVEAPDPAALRGGTRRTLLRALRQLRAPAGPELLVGCEHLLGPVYARFFLRSMQANALVSGMAPLIPTLRFEWHPLERLHRLPEEAAFRAQRLCRHCLNVLSSFAASMDAHYIQRVHLLAQHRAHVGFGPQAVLTF